MAILKTDFFGASNTLNRGLHLGQILDENVLASYDFIPAVFARELSIDDTHLTHIIEVEIPISKDNAEK